VDREAFLRRSFSDVDHNKMTQNWPISGVDPR
jgi:hypothetical protein